jgi:hypothetical protein
MLTEIAIVDHDYGSDDRYRVVDPNGAGISDADIAVYVLSDYNAGNRGKFFIKARTETDVDGRWRDPLVLEAASYVFVFSKSGDFQSRAVTATVLPTTI